jgi:tetratricopeptide (TPR) repeat protein
MKPARVLPITVVLAGCLSLAAAQQSGEPPRPTPSTVPAAAPAAGEGQQRAAAEVPPGDLAHFVTVIKTADDLLVAISAYARGCEIDPKDLALHKAFLERMLQADLPGLAHEAARFVASAEPNNGRAWAVVAHMHARGGELEKALAAVVQAGRSLPTDPFVLRTAGQLLARYDHEKGVLKIPDSLETALETLRKRLEAQKEFTQAYESTRGALEKQPGRVGEKQPVPKTPGAKPVEGGALSDRSREAERQARALESEIRSLEEAIRQGSLGRSYADRPDSGDAYFYYYSGPAYGYPYWYPYLPYGYVAYSGRGWGGTGVRIRGTFNFSGGRFQGRFRIGSGWSRLGAGSSSHRIHNLNADRYERSHSGGGAAARPPTGVYPRPGR